MTITQIIRSFSLFPINPLTAESIAVECGFNPDDAVTPEIRQSKAYRRAMAKTYQYLADAPTITEAGASFSLSDEQRKEFRNRANAIFEEIGDETAGTIGYIGEDL